MGDFDLGAMSQAVAGATAIGLVAWLVKRTFGHTIPRMAGDFKEALDGLTARFSEELRAQREEFRAELHVAREQFRAELAAQRADFKTELTGLGEKIEKLAKAVDDLEDRIRG